MTKALYRGDEGWIACLRVGDIIYSRVGGSIYRVKVIQQERICRAVLVDLRSNYVCSISVEIILKYYSKITTVHELFFRITLMNGIE